MLCVKVKVTSMRRAKIRVILNDKKMTNLCLSELNVQ